MSSIRKKDTITVDGVVYKTHSIDNISNCQLNNKIYNLEVDADNSYTVGSYVVHNCDD